MQPGNFLTIAAVNIRISYKHTLLPAAVLLFGIPLVYGTANLDCVQSAACLERMTALIGIPMFAALARQEHMRGIYETIALRPISLRFVIALRAALSAVCTLLLIFLFEIHMRLSGCSFPFFLYSFRTLAASMALGFTGLLLSLTAQNTIVGYAGAFCFSFMLQSGAAGEMFQPVTQGVGIPLMLFLGAACMAILCFCKPRYHGF